MFNWIPLLIESSPWLLAKSFPGVPDLGALGSPAGWVQDLVAPRVSYASTPFWSYLLVTFRIKARREGLGSTSRNTMAFVTSTPKTGPPIRRISQMRHGQNCVQGGSLPGELVAHDSFGLPSILWGVMACFVWLLASYTINTTYSIVPGKPVA